MAQWRVTPKGRGTNKHNNLVLSMPCGIRTFCIRFPYSFSINTCLFSLYCVSGTTLNILQMYIVQSLQQPCKEDTTDQCHVTSQLNKRFPSSLQVCLLLCTQNILDQSNFKDCQCFLFVMPSSLLSCGHETWVLFFLSLPLQSQP